MGDPARSTRILAYMKEPERSGLGFDKLATQFDRVEVNVASSPDEAAPYLERAHILISHGAHLDADAGRIFRAAKILEWVQSFGSAIDNIADHPDLPAGTVVTNVHGVHGPQLSEAAFAAMLSFARHLPETIRNQAIAVWRRPTPSTLFGKTVGVLGLGAIASDLAPRCKAFGMRVIGITKHQRDVPGFDALYTTAQLERIVGDLDYLVVLTPYTTSSHHLVDAKIISAMRPNAVLVNLAQGGVVDEAALLRALDDGVIRGAALDVFETEPLPNTSRLWSHPRVLVTPHIAGFYDGYSQQAYAIVAKNLDAYLRGGAAALPNLASTTP